MLAFCAAKSSASLRVTQIVRFTILIVIEAVGDRRRSSFAEVEGEVREIVIRNDLQSEKVSKKRRKVVREDG